MPVYLVKYTDVFFMKTILITSRVLAEDFSKAGDACLVAAAAQLQNTCGLCRALLKPEVRNNAALAR